MESKESKEHSLSKEKTGEDFHSYLEAGRQLASPTPGQEVVITGIAGRFADADDVYKYRDNLFGQVSMVSKDNRRWKPTNPEVPYPSGKINCLEKFDAGFFGIHYRQAQHMDPACRQLLERAYEAVLDAGFHPEQLRGTRTGVYIGATYSETEKTWLFDNLESPTYAATGVNRSTLAHWISYYMGLKGRSSIISTACSTSAQVLNDAYIDIRLGKCESALVGATNLCLHPMMSLALYRLGILCLDGQCKSFDDRANGYVRSEGVAVIFLQKASNARRIYSQIYHIKTNCDGYKPEGIQQPSPIMQQELVSEVYEECNISPQDLDYFEAHATGTHVGDFIEVASIDEAICSKRKTPLYIGSTKSVLGHTEATSGISAIVKMIMAMEHDCLLPISNYKYAREELKAIKEGRMVLVTKLTPWPAGGKGFTAINSFGFGGTNGHIVLKRFQKRKVNNGEPLDNLPRLICVSGRTETSIVCLLDDISKRNLDEEFVRLLHEVFRDDILGHFYRGYLIKSKTGEISRSLQWFVGQKQPLCLVFGNLGKEWLRIGTDLLIFPLFQNAIERVNIVLSTKGINISDMLYQRSPIDAFIELIGAAAIQLALIDTLKSLDIVGSCIVGYSVGVLAAAYADGVLTLEQAILIAYYNMKVMTTEIENNYNLQSKFSKQIRPKLLQHIQQLLPKPKQWSAKWISTSRVKKLSKIASAEYFTDSLLRLSKLREIESILPLESVVLTIGFEPVNQHNSTIVDLVTTKTNAKITAHSLLYGLGRLYELGYNPKLEKLYPNVQWPVSVGTPMISPLIKWNHVDDWFVAHYEIQEKLEYAKRIVTFSIEQPEWAFMAGHVLDGHNIVPAMGYLYFVWETLAMVMDLSICDMKVAFETVRFHRATNIPKNEHVRLTITVHKLSGKFEIEELGEPVVTGKIYVPEEGYDEKPETLLTLETTNKILLTTEDIYRELNLRGYNYTGAFRALKECDLTTSQSFLEWKDNWIAFIDNMLQMQLLLNDTRNLYVPTGIEQLTIDAPAHIQCAQNLVGTLPVYVYKEHNTISSGAIEIRGMTTSSMPKSKFLDEPLLEICRFVAHETELTVQQSIRVTVQILLENNFDCKVRVVEEATNKCSSFLASAIYQALSEYPLTQHEIVVLSKLPIEVANAKVENRTLSTEINTSSLIVVSHGLSTHKVISDVRLALKENGFVLSREDLDLCLETVDVNALGLTVVSTYQTETEKLVLLRKTRKVDKQILIDLNENTNISDNISNIQVAARNGQKVIVFSQNMSANGTGMLALVHCFRHEPESSNIQFFFMEDTACTFNLNNEFYLKQINKRLAINVFKYGKWGTYRNFLLEKEPIVECEHIFNSATVRGDFSSLQWIEGPLTSKTSFVSENVQVYCASINSRDVMFVAGRVSIESVVKDCTEQYNVLGMEFSGRDATGRRVMGLVNNGALASMVTVDSDLTWEIPSTWSMEDAATVPTAYVTAMYGLIMVSQIKLNQTILIHGGASDIGQAAINIALYHKCKIFTTVETQEQHNFIKTNFPQIPENHIGNCRTTSFKQMILRETYGFGVNVILNSLSGEKLQASIGCLAPGGKLLDIVKPDSTNSNTNSLNMCCNDRSFHGIKLYTLLTAPTLIKKAIKELIIDGLRTNCIKPLNSNVFEKENVEQAFRYMAAHKHMGKVVINLRKEEQEKVMVPKATLFSGLSRFYCNCNRSYIVVGELETFGLELLDWLVRRGAKFFLLVSKQPIKSGYQAFRISIWRSYGVTIKALTLDLTTKETCKVVINEATKLGPIAGIFNLELLIDPDLENQNYLNGKVVSAEYLNVISQRNCPMLEKFVVFLFTSNGYRQANYSFIASKIERICEKRKKEGYPALAIRWGTIETINSLSEHKSTQREQQSNRILPQKISSCLNVMNIFLTQEDPVVSSIVLSKKEEEQTENHNILDIIKNMIGLKDVKTISIYTPLSELGMDSILAVEVKQILEKEFKTTFTAHDVRNISFDRLQTLSDDKLSEKGK